ncbi:Fe(2+) transporter permease subunit FeoB [Thioalkalivibrio sp. XN279]|uniref:Fe(2+) transporter permease subunit FeoB n=1 Tax=Thioalkalivibrio sp. XN279 TaxID=2714953 RepID=UPI00140B6ECC|nr:Fe(2+) transporter permease subunit FeoB [Thioalkalivibrio sp. XN279]NHA15647.1 Fe(2+) transporter permease subunit FeoB [Thioalkalivibrio sp. XN279]
MKTNFTLGLVGNPNCGKTTLFNALTGARQKVGNWPGVTVERKTGEFAVDGQLFTVVDLPGTYSLDVVDHEISLDEQVARDFVQGEEVDLMINVVDASNLERNLYLSAQLAEIGVPLLVVLNMVDVAETAGLEIDPARLAALLGCPVACVVSSTGKGIPELKQLILELAAAPPRPALVVPYPAPVENALARLDARLEDDLTAPRWRAIQLLEGDPKALGRAGPALAAKAAGIRDELADDLDIMIADGRFGFANRAVSAAVQVSGRSSANVTERLDRVVLNRVLGIPIFLGLMYLVFMLTINIGSAFIDFFDQFVGTIAIDGLAAVLGALGSPDWLTVLLADGIGGGLQVVATFIPVIAFLYFFISILEDSGYMARAAFVMDRLMGWIGLPGKSFVPLIVGFGCNVPSIMATRTLEQRRDRLLTIAMAPFMSCGARLPVYVLFGAAFFPHGAQNVVFALYLIGMIAAVATGLALKNTLLQGQSAPYIMELPRYHMPTLRGLMIHTWDRLKSFIVRAGRVIVPMVLVLNVLNSIGTDGSFGNEDSDRSVLAEVGRTITPAFSPMGLSEDNWPAAVGIFTGVLAKEAVVGTLDAAYTALGAADMGAVTANEEAFDLLGGLAAAFATIPANLLDAVGSWADPLGLDVGDLSDLESVAAEQEVASATFGAMALRFDGTAGAFAYLLFILLYFPCTAAIAAVYQESGARWAGFVGFWTTGMAYGLATIYYQAAIFSRDPTQSTAWIAAVIAAMAATVLVLRRMGRQSLGVPVRVGESR